MARKYSNVSKMMTLTASITITDTQLHVDDASGLPSSFPYVVVVDYEQPGVEICLVTAAAGNILTVVRGQEDTAAQPHTIGSTVVHAATAQDLQQAADHVEATTNVHGVGPGNAVVGTGTVQTLTGKTMSGTNNTFTNIPGSAVVGPIAGTIAVANVVGDWPIDTRSTGNLPIDTRTTGSIPIDTRTTGNLPGSRVASPITPAMTFSNPVTLLSTLSVAGGGTFGGSVLSGNSTTTAANFVDVTRLMSAEVYRVVMYLDSGLAANFEFQKGGVVINRLRLMNDGNIRIDLGTTARYLPWAMYVAQSSITVSSATNGTQAITFPAGRFTQIPRVVATCGYMEWNAGANATTTTGFTLVVRHIAETPSSGAILTDIIAVQMLSGAGSGLVEAQPALVYPEETVTCHTEGCENAEIPIVLQVAEGSGVQCGVCNQPIEDRVPVAPAPEG